MREDDVSFRMKNPITGLESMCRASLAHTQSIENLVGVAPFIRSAKNDQDGEGHRYYFPTLVTQTEKAFCFATELFLWAQRAKPLPGDPFLTYRGPLMPAPRWLGYKTFLIAIKLSAKYNDFDPTRFGTHSLRIGGATILAAAGHPNHYIQKMGRWKSLTFLQYINLACKSMETALHSLVDPTQFTNDQLRILNPM